MDELDRTYRRLVQNIRASFPELLTRPFEVAQVYQQLIPYRLNRKELAFDNNEEYELALMQLLSGARGMLAGDPEMQAALRKELDSPNPDLSAFRAHATAMVALVPDALRALDAQPATKSPGIAPGVPAAKPAEQAVMATRATEELSVAAKSPSFLHTPAPARQVGVAPSPVSVTPPFTGGCRYCGGLLPDGRKVTFCPQCGNNLTVQHCQACSTELDVEWRFCITCGLEVGKQDASARK